MFLKKSGFPYPTCVSHSHLRPFNILFVFAKVVVPAANGLQSSPKASISPLSNLGVQKVPSLSDLSDGDSSLGKCILIRISISILILIFLNEFCVDYKRSMILLTLIRM